MQPPNSSYNPPDPLANPALAGMTKISLANRYFHHYSAPDSIVMSCLCVCLYVACPRSYLWNCTSDLHLFLCMLPMAVARSSSAGTVICYVFPVLWMTSCLLISKVTRRRRPAEAQRTRSLRLVYKLCALIPIAQLQASGRTTLLFGRLRWLPRWKHRGRSLRSITALFPLCNSNSALEVFTKIRPPPEMMISQSINQSINSRLLRHDKMVKIKHRPLATQVDTTWLW